MPQYYRILDNGMPQPRKSRGNSEVARKRMRGKDMKNSKQDAWTKNDELLYKLMGGKSKTRYAEDQATYREFGRTYGGPTDAASVAMRKRREAGDFSFGEKPKKRMGPSTPRKKAGNKKNDSVRGENMRKRKRYDDKMGFKPEFVGKPPKKNVKRGAK
jgi:hypothetical protein